MPETTQQRSLPSPYHEFYHRVGSGPRLNGRLRLAEGWQKTTSYRSSSNHARQLEEEERLFNSNNRAQLARELSARHALRYDTGHNFLTEKVEHKVLSDYGLHVVYPGTSSQMQYAGPVYPDVILPGIDTWSTLRPSNTKVSSDGANAIKATIPTSPEVSLAQFVGELKEKLPQLIGMQTYKKGISPSSAGSEYLNLEFGVKPFISDLFQLAHSIADSKVILDQLKRDSGRVVRRRATLRETHETKVITNGSFANPLIANRTNPTFTWTTFYSSSGRLYVFDDIYQRTYFSGAYMYHLAQIDNFLDKMSRYEQMANHLLGTRITPSTVWELTPWSWLVDWFSDTGTFISNVSALAGDNVVLRYGYVMHEIRVKRTQSLLGMQPLPGATTLRSCSLESNYTHKRRTRATPYGFGVDLGTLTPRRWAILGALGLTKSDKTLARLD